MVKSIFPFKVIENQRVWSIVILLLSIFLIFSPQIKVLGIILFLISAFYLLKTFI